MSNISYQIERIEDGMVHLLETFDLTDTNGPGILMRNGQVVDAAREAMVSATRRIMMTEQQAFDRGLIVRALTCSSACAR